MIVLEAIKSALVNGDPLAIDLVMSIIGNTKITSLTHDQVILVVRVMEGQK